ncbi:hypothetical protein [Alkalicoccobacillus gibsonii]|uniref:hypothetical protein n=1 Tax=Alkalicoccobacillus gibsonii TaxID=79881 RepID=UPI0019318801|nr:hypothetical protein [Alkalicoccobacillus gibsonii]MBM0065921.1 hypothetical protein [Alkalicoccobacillus gibsonii]
MANIPAICRSCKFFLASLFNSEYIHQTTLKNNIISSCPRCGGIADVLEGTFAVTEGNIKVRSAPAATRFALRQLENLSIQVINEQVDLEQFESEAKHNSLVKEIIYLLPKDRKE